jgi:UTP:GlnB (protein PII) uridylyltransferase
VAEAVLDPDSLTMLYALSAADYMAGARQRNDHAMHTWLARAFKAGDRAMNLSGIGRDREGKKRRIVQDYARSVHLSDSIAMERVEAHLDGLPASYLSEVSTEEVVHHLIGVSQEMLPYIYWMNEVEDEGHTSSATRLQRVVIVAPDRTGLLSRMCGGIPFPITEARIFTTRSGMACNSITCAVPQAMFTTDLIRYSSKVKASLSEVHLPSERFIQEYSATLARAGREPDRVSYDVNQVDISASEVCITIKGPDRTHLASVIAALLPGIVSAKFARGARGTVNDSFILSRRIPEKKLRTLTNLLNERAGILPEESV